jgi:hypothetical protein
MLPGAKTSPRDILKFKREVYVAQDLMDSWMEAILAIGPARHGLGTISDRHGLARGWHDTLRAGP